MRAGEQDAEERDEEKARSLQQTAAHVEDDGGQGIPEQNAAEGHAAHAFLKHDEKRAHGNELRHVPLLQGKDEAGQKEVQTGHERLQGNGDGGVAEPPGGHGPAHAPSPGAGEATSGVSSGFSITGVRRV